VFKGIVGALLMFFAFYGLVIGCMVGSDVGWLPPIFAAILPHAVFLAIGGWLFYRQR
jgi:lipopolysaccharide export LptBFGC system permease protein LptF